MSKTTDNLKAAFAGESQANRKYLAFAKKAEEEGYLAAARLFRVAAHAETIHAHNHLRVLSGVKSTAENLQVAIEGENYEHTFMYPDFISEAETEGEKRAITSFRWASDVEKIHENLFKETLANLSKETKTLEYYVCPICGYVHIGGIPDKCPVCNTPGDRFEKID